MNKLLLITSLIVAIIAPSAIFAINVADTGEYTTQWDIITKN